ncbi:GNAT family N-acetyltransferase [Pseudomonas sp. 10B1]|uniref:GNAT family N-acetyltransferase n=1 Tax=unclassified Pseudomonas TaxID=196821 RepID=UPI002AB52EF3|nr:MULTISPECIES: GNAT family N-acetyltransferase [unclassified Pseudomonas]MDY7560483.1 GNAT family N-acetyltransferase [Pseudomonas sp. AB6]MEA9975923.1 GNAT family N-acetyltransferase [Pseudomonas sp. RTS4]MEA9993240.1 GNAT family N-acetyltransferase [Pseudomonas sp. AA4]MEB0088064.1 GNAT family N-acetyltransferase [Pseudomonas sp. RTI1]MEB0124273.1 GNAT family N-acetyltransferase [Pseudomonas sp. CCC1.2]
MSIRIDVSQSPGETEYLAILKPLRAYNFSQAGDAKPERFALLIRDEQSDEIIGGLYGRSLYSWLFVELLAVPEQCRGQGMGSRLMHMAEDHARSQDCIGIWLDTFSFQAPEFYRKHGFVEFAKVEDFPPGHQRFFFQKRLNSSAVVS